MEEATMSQDAETTAIDELEAAEMGGLPTKEIKKPARFSADAFRALSSRLNSNTAPVIPTQTQPNQPAHIQPEYIQAEQIIPDLEIAPVADAPEQAPSQAPMQTIDLAHQTHTVVESTVSVSGDTYLQDTIVAGQQPQGQDNTPINPVSENDQEVSAMDDGSTSTIPQFDVPNVEIPNIAMPQNTTEPQNTFELENTVDNGHYNTETRQQPTLLGATELAHATPELTETANPITSKEFAPEAVMPEPVATEPVVSQAVETQGVAEEQMAAEQVAEPEFLDLSQFTQSPAPENNLVSDPLPAQLTETIEATDQNGLNVSAEQASSHSTVTSVSSLSLAEMLANEQPVAIENDMVPEQIQSDIALTPVPNLAKDIPEIVMDDANNHALTPLQTEDENQPAVEAQDNTAPQTQPYDDTLPQDGHGLPQGGIDEVSAKSELGANAEPRLEDLFADPLGLSSQPVESQLQVSIGDIAQDPIAQDPITQDPAQETLLVQTTPIDQHDIAATIQTNHQSPSIPSQPEVASEPQLDTQAQAENISVEPSQEFDLQAAIDSQRSVESEVASKVVANQQPTTQTLAPKDQLTPEVPTENAQLDLPTQISEIVVPTSQAQDEVAQNADEQVVTLQDAIEPVEPLPQPVAPSQITQAETSTALLGFTSQSGTDPLLEAMRLMNEVNLNTDAEVSNETVQSVETKVEPAAEIMSVDEDEPRSKILKPSNENVHDEQVLEQFDEQLNVAENVVEIKSAETKTNVEAQNVQTPQAPHTAQIEATTPPAQDEIIEPEYDLELEPDEKSGETARALLDMMSASGGAAQPQERALAADTLLQLVPRMPERDLIALSDRVGMMDDPPALLVNKLINNRSARVAQPLLESGQVVSDQHLLALIQKCEVDRLTMISKRRQISSGVCDELIARGDASVYLTLVRNPGAGFSHDAFIILCEIAKNQQTLQAPLATRGDTPAPIAFELFWSLPVELRRYILSRFLTDSATLDKILKIAQTVGSDEDVEAAGDQHFPTRRKVDELVELIAEGVIDTAVEKLAELAEIQPDNARRIVTDADGEPLTVAFKTLGISRANFSKAIKLFSTTPSAPLSAERDLQELQAMFDGLSFNKARTLMKYWDWATEKTGPYARRSI